MIRADMISTVGRKYLTSNIENDQLNQITRDSYIKAGLHVYGKLYEIVAVWR